MSRAETNEDPKALEKRLTAEIMERVREIARLRNRPEPFTPGKSPVRYAGRVYDENEMVNLVDSALEFNLTAGRWHRRLEAELGRWYALPHVRLVNSGSSANLLAVATLANHPDPQQRLRPGDEVITVAAGFPTTVAPLFQHGLVPVFIDIDVPTYNADISLLEKALSPKTRAVMMAHTLGNPFDLDAVVAFCQRHDLWLVEDNCDASGSVYRGRKAGTFGDLATLSFYPPHHMTMGEGGAVLCKDDELMRVLESLRDWGRDCWCPPAVDNTCGKRFAWQFGELPTGYDHKYTYTHLGYNLKVTDMQASVGLAQLAKLDGFGAARRKNWATFRKELSHLDDYLILPEPTPGADPSWFGFMAMVKDSAPFSRSEIVAHLEAKKIQTRMLFAGNLTRQPALTSLAADAKERGAPPPFRVCGSLERTDKVMNQAFWLGVYPGLTEQTLAFMIDEVKAFVAERSAKK